MSFNPSSRRLWTAKGSKPVQMINGSHSNVCFLGAVSDDGNHCFTAKRINEVSFIGFARYLLRLYGKVVLIADRAMWHFRSKKVKKFVKACNGRLILWPLPKMLPELNPMEHGWRSARQNVTWKLFPDKKCLGQAVKSHIRNDFRTNLFSFWS